MDQSTSIVQQHNCDVNIYNLPGSKYVFFGQPNSSDDFHF